MDVKELRDQDVSQLNEQLIVAREAFELAAAKLPVKTTVIKRTIM